MSNFMKWTLPALALLAGCENQQITSVEAEEPISALSSSLAEIPPGDSTHMPTSQTSQLPAFQEIGNPLAEDQSLNECARIRRDVERLVCFDALAVSRGYQPTGTRSTQTGKWTINETVNPIDDTRQVTLSLTAEPASSTSRFGGRPNFIARCRSNETEAYILWHTYVGDDSSSPYSEWKHVTVRVGSAQAERQRWTVSTDRRATFAPSWAGNLLRRMAESNSLIAQMTPYGENPMTAIFDTTGMADALAPLMEVCDWNLTGEAN